MAATVYVLHYSFGTAPPDADGGLHVWNWWGSRKWLAQRDRMVSKGAEVLKYVLPTHDYPYSSSEPEQALWYTGKTSPVGGHPSPREWYWDPANPARVSVNSYGGWVMDMRKGSKFVDHLMNDVVPKAQRGDLGWRDSGWLLDVTGDGYYGAFSGLQASEKAEWSEGIREFIRLLRQELPKHIFIGNNAWDKAKGPIDLHGMMIENHSVSEIPYWRDNQIPLFQPTDGRKRVVTINLSTADAVQWSNVPGVAAAGYDKRTIGAYQLGTASIPGITVRPMPGTIDPYGTVTPPPPPPPPPADCDAVKAELAIVKAQLANEIDANTGLTAKVTGLESRIRAMKDFVASA